MRLLLVQVDVVVVAAVADAVAWVVMIEMELMVKELLAYRHPFQETK